MDYVTTTPAVVPPTCTRLHADSRWTGWTFGSPNLPTRFRRQVCTQCGALLASQAWHHPTDPEADNPPPTASRYTYTDTDLGR